MRFFRHDPRIDRTECLARPRIDEAAVRALRPEIFQAHVGSADIDRQHVLPDRLVTAARLAMHRGDMKDEAGTQRLEKFAQTVGVAQIQGDVAESLALDAIGRLRLARHAGDLVAAAQQMLHEVTAVLAVTPQNERSREVSHTQPVVCAGRRGRRFPRWRARGAKRSSACRP
jgi:hypothetical protein